MGIELGRIYDVVNDEGGVAVGNVAFDVGEDGLMRWQGVLLDGTIVEGIVKKSPAGHYRLMDGATCVGTVSDALAVNGPEAGENSPWGGPATLT